MSFSKSYESPEAIVAGIFAGDNDAEHALIEKYQESLYLILLHRTKDPELARDLVQDTFIVVLGKLRDEALEIPTKLSAYLHQTAVFLHIGEIRKAERRKTSADTPVIEAAMNDSEQQYRQVLENQAHRAVRRLISELTRERDRQILCEYYLEEKDKKTICNELNLDHRHFDRVIWRARRRFEQLLDEEMKDFLD